MLKPENCIRNEESADQGSAFVYPTNAQIITTRRAEFFKDVAVHHHGSQTDNERVAEREAVDPENIYSPKLSVLDLIGEQ